MNFKKGLILGAQILVCVGLGIGLYMYNQNVMQPVKAYVYATDIDKNVEVTEDSIQQIQIPKKALQEGFALKKEDIVGKFADTDVKLGQYIYIDQLKEEEKIDIFEVMDLSKYRKISFAIDLETGFGGDLKRGDFVDLLYVSGGQKEDEDGGTEQNFVYGKAFIQNVPVYSVVTDTGESYSQKENEKNTENEDSEEEPKQMAVVTIALTLQQAEEYETRKEAGKITLAGRFESSQDIPTSGYVIGDYEKIKVGEINVER